MWWHLRWGEKVLLGFSSSTLVEGMPEGKNRRLEGWGPIQDSEESGVARVCVCGSQTQKLLEKH